MKKRLGFSMAAILGLASVATAELVDNPNYKAWAAFKPGTSITFKVAETVSTVAPPTGAPPPRAGGRGLPPAFPQHPSDHTETTTLLEVKPDSLTLEITSSVDIRPGVARETRTISARYDRPAPATASAPSTQPRGDNGAGPRMGNETLEVGGKVLETVTTETDSNGFAGGSSGMVVGAAMRVDTHTKVWESAAVPGGTVKRVVTTTYNEERIRIETSTRTLTGFSIGK